jgi:alpha-ketoglutarate-dependent taurine dioxygenase
MDFKPLDASFGAIVHGVRLTELDDSEFSTLYDAWLEYALLVFPGQHLTNPQQIEFARRFGKLEFDLSAISNVKKNGTLRADDLSDDVVKVLKGNMGWHCDSTYMPVQAKGAVFTAHVVPKTGGQTGWADMRAAYDALDAATREQISDLRAHHSLYHSQAKLGHTPTKKSTYHGYGFNGQEPPLRPLVKTHPETGRKTLAIGRHAYGIPGLDEEKSEVLLQSLVDTACVAPRVYHHTWTAGDAVVWDNRCLMHQARPWDMSEPRVMYHSRIAGDDVTEFAAPH